MTDSLLAVRDLTVRYGSLVAVSGASFEISAGEILCLVGANGAGKSSCLKGIMGLATASGDVALEGRALGTLSTEQRVRAGLALVPEGRHVFPAMSVRENLLLGWRAAERAGQAQRIDEILEIFPRLGERLTQAGGTLSGGEQQMLAIGRALMSRPRVLLLDEPTLGLAPIMVERVAEVLVSLRAHGLAILLAEQNLRMALAVTDRGVVLETGRVTLRGTAQALSADARVRQAYLGMS